MKYSHSRNQRWRRAHRQGGAAVELVVCLPVIVLLILGALEACGAIFLRQSLTVAAYEGARAALLPNATSASATTRSQQVIDDRRVIGATIATDPSDITTAVPGEYVTVTVTAPSDQNALFIGRFFRGRTLTGRAEMMKEF